MRSRSSHFRSILAAVIPSGETAAADGATPRRGAKLQKCWITPQIENKKNTTPSQC